MKRPDHIPENLVVDYDYHRPQGTGFGEAGHEDPFLHVDRLCRGRGMFWTPRNDGHWVATRSDDFRTIMSDSARFSSRAVFIPTGPHTRILPLESDPPEHGAYRRILNSAFEPGELEPWLGQARALAVSRIEELRPRGHCDFIHEFAIWFPSVVLFRMCGLPETDRASLVQWISANLRPSDQHGGAGADAAAFLEYIRRLVNERGGSCPVDRLIGRIFRSRIKDDRQLNDEELFGMINGVLGGGADTTAASLGWAGLFLAKSAEHRERLIREIENPARVANAALELLRRFSASNTARVVTQDMTYNGVLLKKGEQILLQSCLYSLDEEIFERPAEVDFERANAGAAVTFSHGPHRCPARNLALAELSIFLEEWLKRIPRFEVDPSAPVRTATGIVHAVVSLPLRWEAGA